jgi:hypothetical protein
MRAGSGLWSGGGYWRAAGAAWLALGVGLVGGVAGLPEGAEGIASRYPGDRGIEDDEAVVFVERFEQAEVGELAGKWESVKGVEIFSFSDEVPDGSGGGRSLLMSHVGGRGDGGHLYRRLEPGYESLNVRFYVRFDEECEPIHHFFHVGGYRPATAWPQGGAGVPPEGDRRFTTGIEPFGAAWRWDFYSYWMEMGGSPPRGQTWGNSFLNTKEVKVERGRWICVEVMIRLNRVGDSDGEQALWIDGELVGHVGKGFPRGKWVFDKFMAGEGGESWWWDEARGGRVRREVAEGGEAFDGIRWRDHEDLKINFLWPLFYITGSTEGRVSRVWFDHIVAAEGYIGPLRVVD